jgi:Glycosyl hydrolase family 26
MFRFLQRSGVVRITFVVSTLAATGLTALGVSSARSSAAAVGSTGKVGVYVGYQAPGAVSSFGRAIGKQPTFAMDFLDGDSWSALVNTAPSYLSAWKGSGYTMIWGLPMLPNSGSTLGQGATGAYNSYFVTLAQTLVAGGAANAYLRLGWEFDGSWTIWNATTASAEASYASYFQQIVTAMRSVSGENFRFVWNPDATAFTNSSYSVEAAYPGNSYVDVIGLDLYDQTWATPQTPANAWSSTVSPALTAAQQFASSEGKPIALTEWGAIIRSDGHGLGDDPYYINHMISWMQSASNDVVYESYFDFNDSGLNSQLTGGSFPNSLAAFDADLT